MRCLPMPDTRRHLTHATMLFGLCGDRRWRGVVEPVQDLVQGVLDRIGARVAGNVVQLPGVLPQVVELAPAVLVLDVEVPPRLDGRVLRRAASTEEVPAEVLLEEGVAPRNLLPVQERDEAAAVLGELR